MPDKTDESKTTLAEYKALYDRFRVFFESDDGFNKNWSSNPEFQRLLFNLEIRKNLEKAKLEVEFKLKDLNKNLEKIKNTRNIPANDTAQTLLKTRDEPISRKNKELYAQQKFIRQKNLVNRLKLSLLNIFKNLQMDEEILKSDTYLDVPTEQLAGNCKQFLDNCVYEKLIFNNILEQFKGKVNFEAVKKILESNSPQFCQENKENDHVSHLLHVQPADSKSLYSRSDNVSQEQIDN